MVRRRALWSGCLELFSLSLAPGRWTAAREQPESGGRSWRAQQPEEAGQGKRTSSSAMDEEDEETPQAR